MTPSLDYCPHCSVAYRVVRIEATPDAHDRELTCLSCGGPLPAREGAFFMKYFLVDRPSERQRRSR